MSTEGITRRLVVAAERMADTASEIRKWAAGYPPESMPDVIRQICDAADYYYSQLEEYQRDQPAFETDNQVTTRPGIGSNGRSTD